MPTISPQTTPFYGGGQVVNPANVLQLTSAPSSAAISNNIGTLAVNTSTGTMYGLVRKASGTATWAVLGGAASDVNTLTDTAGTVVNPTAGNIQLAGTANQITVTASSSKLTWTLPVAITAPGSLTATTSLAATTTVTAGTTITATLGNITATNGNVVMSTAGNKLSIATGSNASIGTSVAMTAGSVTISTTAVTASSKIFLTHNTIGGTAGVLSAPTASIVAATSFVINSSSGTDTSTVNWWIVN